MLVLTAVPNVAITYVIDAYQEDTVNAMTMLNVTRNCLGAGFVFITIPLAKSLGVKKASPSWKLTFVVIRPNDWD
jgi:hypothetical protein